MTGAALERDAHLRLVSPASPPKVDGVVEESSEYLQSLGYRVSRSAAAEARHGFLAGSDAVRARDLASAFRLKSVDGVLCVRGGYGSQRILAQINAKEIANTRKPLIGFSDITALLIGVALHGGWAIHGPMAASLKADSKISTFSQHHLQAALHEPHRERSILEQYTESNNTIEVVRSGFATGRIWGGNLTLLSTLLGTPWFPPLRNGILLLEEVGEAPYRIDRMLTHLILSGALKGVRGIAVGICSGCDPTSTDVGQISPSWRSVFRERLYGLKIPVVLGLPVGHIPFNAAVPLGERVELDAKAGDLIIAGLRR
jgi:muramoyltetrapeptide carboxypeptidase